MIDLTLTGAPAGFYARAWFTPAYADYLRDHHLDIDVILVGAGASAVIPIIDCGNGRFDFGKPELDPLAFVCEVIAEDGETIEDLIAWPISESSHVMTISAALVSLACGKLSTRRRTIRSGRFR